MVNRTLMLVLLLGLCSPLFAQTQGTTVPAWLEKIKISGDFRYRHELISSDRKDPDGGSENLQNPDRNRNRLRLRLSVGAVLNPKWDLVTRFATSNGKPNATNQDMTDAFTLKAFYVERAYVDYHPLTGLSGRVGKFGVPFEGTDLVWDADVNPEGVALTLVSKKFMGGWELLGRAGGFWVQERLSGPDVGLVGVQGGAKYSGDVFGGQFAVAYHDYTNIKNSPANFGSNSDNTVYSTLDNPTLRFRNDYDLLNINGQLKLKRERWEGTIIGDYVTNMGTEEDTAATGFLAGISFKFKKLPVDWDLGYNFRRLERDATIASFTDSDSRGGGTNFEGHRFSLFFGVAKDVRLGSNYLMAVVDPDGVKTDFNIFQIDLEAKF